MCDHSESEFMFNLIQLASLWLWGLLPTPTWLNMTLAPPRKRCKHSCVPVLLKARQQNLFPIDVKVTFSRVGTVFASILQLMFYFTLCEVTECSLMTKYNNLLTISLKKKKGKVEIKTLVSEKYRWNHRPRCCMAIHVFSQR